MKKSCSCSPFCDYDMPVMPSSLHYFKDVPQINLRNVGQTETEPYRKMLRKQKDGSFKPERWYRQKTDELVPDVKVVRDKDLRAQVQLVTDKWFANASNEAVFDPFEHYVEETEEIEQEPNDQLPPVRLEQEFYYCVVHDGVATSGCCDDESIAQTLNHLRFHFPKSTRQRKYVQTHANA